MDKPRLVQKFNEAISLELCALLQYNHNSQVLIGRDKRIWHELFEEMAKHGLEHARKFGERVVALGGNPTVQPAAVTQATAAEEMLRNALDLEKRLVQVYTEALEFCQDSPAYRNMLEEQIFDEVVDVEELEKYLGQIQKVAESAPAARRQGKTG
jgi:bacterioferritin (cytochrome b1)